MISFLVQKLLSELFVRALTGAKLVLAGAELVHCKVKLSLAQPLVASQPLVSPCPHSTGSKSASNSSLDAFARNKPEVDL